MAMLRKTWVVTIMPPRGELIEMYRRVVADGFYIDVQGRLHFGNGQEFAEERVACFSAGAWACVAPEDNGGTL